MGSVTIKELHQWLILVLSGKYFKIVVKKG